MSYKKLMSLMLAPFFMIFVFAWAQDAAPKAQPVDVTGVWLTQKPEKNAKIKIFECDGRLCGEIVWLETPIDPDTGKPKLDKNNKEESLRTRPLMGLRLLSDFQGDPENPKGFINGHIYNPEDGDMYKCKMELQDDGTLKVKGFVEFLMFTPGKEQIWKKVG